VAGLAAGAMVLIGVTAVQRARRAMQTAAEND
jgi:hypothetical protein